jgi:hypothetical protein
MRSAFLPPTAAFGAKGVVDLGSRNAGLSVSATPEFHPKLDDGEEAAGLSSETTVRRVPESPNFAKRDWSHPASYYQYVVAR